MPKSRTHGGSLLRPFQASTNAPKSTTEEWHSVAALHVVSTKAVQLRPAPSNSRGAPLDIAIEDAKEGTTGGKKRYKQRRQETVTDHDRGVNERAGDSSAEHAAEAMGSSRRQARPPTDHFEKLLKEALSNHTYPVKHKLRDYSMMKSFMTSWSLSRGLEVNAVSAEDDATPFPREGAVMTIYDRRAPLTGEAPRA
jgi:hypothetical protein